MRAYMLTVLAFNSLAEHFYIPGNPRPTAPVKEVPPSGLVGMTATTSPPATKGIAADQDNYVDLSMFENIKGPSHVRPRQDNPVIYTSVAEAGGQRRWASTTQRPPEQQHPAAALLASPQPRRSRAASPPHSVGLRSPSIRGFSEPPSSPFQSSVV